MATSTAFLAVPADLAMWRAREVESLRAAIRDETHVDADGAIFWNANGAPVPPHTFRDAFVAMPPAQQPAHDADVRRFVAEYRTARAAMTAEERAEERAEARAAHGPGVELVNVVTGERWRT